MTTRDATAAAVEGPASRQILPAPGYVVLPPAAANKSRQHRGDVISGLSRSESSASPVIATTGGQTSPSNLRREHSTQARYGDAK